MDLGYWLRFLRWVNGTVIENVLCSAAERVTGEDSKRIEYKG